jgi:glycosyltransferase involved in cell wall biosynthesis
MKKILLITNIPNPYRAKLFQIASEKLSQSGWYLKLIFGAGSYGRRKFDVNKLDLKFDYELLDGSSITASKDQEKTYFLYRGLSALLRKEKPDVIIVAGFSTATMKVFRYHLFSGTPFIIYSGSTGHEMRRFNLVRRIQRNVLARYAAAFVVYGTRAKNYIIERGITSEKIFRAINTVDTEFFKTETERLRNSENLNSTPVRFTCLGYLVPRKGVRKVLDAVLSLSKTRRDFVLDVIGDGISRNELEHFVKENHLSELVIFHGFRQKEELPSLLASSTAMLFQTGYDIWGLVLNEAMAAGLCCLSAPQAGATHDLIRDGETGFVVDYRDTGLVVEKMNWVLDHPDEARAIGKRASEFISQNITLEKSAQGFVGAVDYVWKHKSPEK